MSPLGRPEDDEMDPRLVISPDLGRSLVPRATAAMTATRAHR